MISIPDWQYILIHQSTKPDGETLDASGIFRYHTSYRIDYHIVGREDFWKRRSNGDGKVFQKAWSDVGYPFLVERIKGMVHVIVGRPLTRYGAHCPQEYMNRKAIGVCYIGNYDADEPDTEMLEISIKRLIIPLMGIFKISCSNILGHRDIAGVKKSCPGRKFNLDTYRNIVKRFS